MIEKLQVKRPIYPVIGLLSTVMILVFGLLSAKSTAGIYFLCGMWLIFLLFGYRKSCISVVPVAVVLCAVLAGITYVISRDIAQTLAAANRILAVCIAVIPSLALSPILLVRNLSSLKLPRMLALGMMITLTFFPLLGDEVKRVREAMKTRGAGGLFSPKIFYRAFLIPLIMRLVNISDTLALSVETRGFTTNSDDCSVYKTIRMRITDIVFLALVSVSSILAVVL